MFQYSELYDGNSCVYMYECVSVYVCVYVCMYVCIYVCVCVWKRERERGEGVWYQE